MMQTTVPAFSDRAERSPTRGPGRRRKVVLVYPGQEASLIHKNIHIHLPLAVLQLAAYLLPRGYEVAIYDTRVQRYEEIDFGDAVAVGFSTMTNPQIRHCLDTAGRLRADGHAMPFIWGGVHPTLFPEECLKHRHVDYVVRKEGEETLYQLLEHLRTGAGDPASILGLSFVDASGVCRSNPDRPNLEMDEVPFPAYDLIDMDRYPKIRTMFDYQTSRGCPFRCDFCYINEVHNRKWRARSAEKVVDDIARLIRTYNVRKFAFVDDELFIDRGRLERMCDLIIERGLKFEWNASCRLDILQKCPPSLVEKIRRSGCNRLYFGAESGSDRILKAIHKDLSVAQIESGVRYAVDNGIVPIVSLMSGFRQETLEDSRMTFRLIRRLWAISPTVEVNGVFFYNPYPGSPLFHDAVEHGVKVPDTLEGWSTFGFDYDGAMPWINASHARFLRTMFYMVRSKYYIQEIWGRPGYRNWQRVLFSLVNLPLHLSRWFRMKYEWFDFAPEWWLWAAAMKRTFGFL